MSEETGISRTPIREALKQLSYEGIITIIPNRGAFVSNPTPDKIKSVFECKKVLEAAAIKIACTNITDKELDVLEDLYLQGAKAHASKDFYMFTKLNDEFHMTIVRASKNSCYEKYVNELIQRSNVYLFFYDNFMFTSADDSEALKGHARILALLKTGDVNGCVEAIERHNQVTLDQLSLNGIIQ
ncbi:GntR family transcriptional regulator [Lutispora sp.]|nr:GntR family transcriptional regulator [Lutispora sp.]MEA4963290.1 GntR family transcriptional regulator [Lutispora sp.]